MTDIPDDAEVTPPAEPTEIAGIPVRASAMVQRDAVVFEVGEQDWSWSCPGCGWHTKDTRYEGHVCPTPVEATESMDTAEASFIEERSDG